MIIRNNDGFKSGFNSITEQHGKNNEMRLDFGILKLSAGNKHTDCQNKERAWLLIKGEAEFSWKTATQSIIEEISNEANETARGKRISCFDENPVVLHVPSGTEVTITAIIECEFALEMCANNSIFPACFYGPEHIESQVFGENNLNETSLRTVRTVFDGNSAPYSNMVLGEVIGHPGRWSSYPPHDHPQPEIYHYRFFPSQGFGISMLEENAFIVHHGDTSLISPNKIHSQVAAPGYAMYYVWMIPHLPDNRWVPSTRYYRQEHEWLLEKGVKIWPDKRAVETEDKQEES